VTAITGDPEVPDYSARKPMVVEVRMSEYAVHTDLSGVLERCCDRIRKPRRTVLFHRGEAALGMYLVLKGMVRLDFGVDGYNPLNGTYGPGALVGLPATLTGRTYSMTATVTDDAELGFISRERLKALLCEQPELGRHLLGVLSAKLAQTEELKKTMPSKEDPPQQKLGVA
jgi:CRP-like cAMP-binding protein